MSRISKQLVLVCDEKSGPYANYLKQLIGSNDDKDGEIVGVEDGTVKAVVWHEKEYIDNRGQLNSNDHVLFIGNSKVSKGETSSMITKYEKYGMKYGWLGKSGMLQVSDELLTEEDYDKFINLCKKYEIKLEKIVMKHSKKKTKEKVKEAGVAGGAAAAGAVGAIGGGALGAAGAAPLVAGGIGIASGVAAGAFAGAIIPAVAIVGAYNGINKYQMKKKIKDQQYRALTVIMYIDGLKKFLEE